MKRIARIIGRMSEVCAVIGICGVIGVYILGLLGVETYIVRSGSMEPVIKTGSLCFIDTYVDYSEIEENDIIAFRRANLLVTHRVTKISDEGFITKGDSNTYADGLTTTSENYVGKNIFSIPAIGYVLGWIQTKRGKVICLTLAVIMCCFQLGISKFIRINTKK